MHLIGLRSPLPLRRFLALAWVGLLALGCKEIHFLGNSSDTEPTPAVPARRTATPQFFAAAAAELTANSAFYFQEWNSSFTTNLAALPMSAQIPDAKKPWTGSYYPDVSGGTDVGINGGTSALTKYDQAFYGGVNTASAWERSHHISSDSWNGHCNGFAASTQRHPQEPAKSVTRGGVTFAPQDVKALMTELHMSADYQFLGGARCDSTAPTGPASRSDPTVMDACQGVNPGTLHAAMANWVGIMNHVIILDLYAGNQVWNHPIISYNVVSKTTVTATQAAQAVDGSSTYAFNPAAVQFAQMDTQIVTVDTSKTGEVLQTRSTTTTELTYILELDASGNIIGGEWTGNSIMNHPNFVWVAFDPLPGNGTKYMGNPNLDSKTVLSMWAESAGLDPNNPPNDIQRTVTASTWGQMTAFTVALDGLSTGASFAGKPVLVHVTRTAANVNVAGVEMDASLNGSPQTPVTAVGSEVLTLTLNPNVGLNKLEFVFKQGGTQIDDETVYFRHIR